MRRRSAPVSASAILKPSTSLSLIGVFSTLAPRHQDMPRTYTPITFLSPSLPYQALRNDRHDGSATLKFGMRMTLCAAARAYYRQQYIMTWHTG